MTDNEKLIAEARNYAGDDFYGGATLLREIADALEAVERKIPFPRICPDCFHDECLAAFDAWQLLTKLAAEDEPV